MKRRERLQKRDKDLYIFSVSFFKFFMRLELLASLSRRRHRRLLSSDAAAARELLRAGLRARREAAAFGEENASPASIASSESTSSSSTSTSSSTSSSTKSQLAAALVAAHTRSKSSPCGEQRFVSVLCSDFGVDTAELARAVEGWRASTAAASASSSSPSSASFPDDDASSAAAAAEERLRRASTPSYEAFWPAVAGVRGGLATLAELRAAALSSSPREEEGGAGGSEQHSGSSRSPSPSPTPRRRAALAASLARSLAPALASGTSLVRLGAAAAATAGDLKEELELLSRAASEAQAALHPVLSARDWELRLRPPRACFALLHERGFGRGVPLATVACFSGEAVARRVSEALPRVEGGGGGGGEEGREEIPPPAPPPSSPSVGGGGPSATLYALCSAQAGLSGLDVGRAAARGVAEALARGGEEESGLPAATRIATLSPLPGFLPWLRAEGRGANGKSRSTSARKLEFRREEVEAIREAAAAAAAASAAKAGGRRRSEESKGSAPLSLLLSTLEGNDGGGDNGCSSPSFPPKLLRPVLLRLAARFLALETVRGMPLDPVARFHCANGAALARLCWEADSPLAPSSARRGRRIREESAGIMVNYSYLWPGGGEEPLSPGSGAGRMRVSEGVARVIEGGGEESGGRWGLVD